MMKSEEEIRDRLEIAREKRSELESVDGLPFHNWHLTEREIDVLKWVLEDL